MNRLRFGPGLLVTAAFIGPGTIVTASRAGAGYGGDAAVGHPVLGGRHRYPSR